jgi:5'-deoxy-5'-methylthioadenosine phosphorylase
MARIAIIGGSGVATIGDLEDTGERVVDTPFGQPSGPLCDGVLGETAVVFLQRHGVGHTIPPHQVNYRANVWALRELGVESVISLAAVGGIRGDLEPGQLVFPDQLIDYTWSRASTFCEDGRGVTHVDFTQPYSERIRGVLCQAARDIGLHAATSGTYGATQGPRLETAAEIDRMERDGCDMVGMTGMPEAGLARELDLEYATCAMIVNRAAGRGEGAISMEEITVNLERAVGHAERLLIHAVALL